MTEMTGNGKMDLSYTEESPKFQRELLKVLSAKKTQLHPSLQTNEHYGLRNLHDLPVYDQLNAVTTH